MTSRKGGFVARIRVSPKDCLAILDIMESLHIDIRDRSFSHCTSFALSSLIAVARKGGILKGEEDGFQYLNRMEPFFNTASYKERRLQTQALYERAVSGLEAPTPGDLHMSSGVATPSHSGVAEAQDPQLLQEYEELKKDLQGEGEADSDMLERFSYLQGVLFP